MAYTRRADYGDLPLPIKLGILQYELQIVTSDEDRKNATAAIEQMKLTIDKLTPKPAPIQDPSLPLGFHDYTR